MAASVISLANRALLSIGARTQISSLTEGSPASNAVNILFTPTFEALGRTAWWNCLRKQGILTLLKAAQGTPENASGTVLPIPPIPWLYEYQLPSDCLHMRYLVPTLPASGTGVALTSIDNNAPTWLPNDGQIPFQVGYDTDASGDPLTVILTSQSQAQAVYTANQPNPSIWDSQLQAAFVAALAAYLVPALALHMPLMQLSMQAAERIIAEARAADGNEGTTSQNRTADWMRARQGGGGYACLGYANYPAYIPFAWPGY